MSLNLKAALGFAALAVAMALVLFGAAGTLRWTLGWIYLAAFFGPSLGITLYLARRDRALLERRLSGGPAAERTLTERIIMSIASLAFIALLVTGADLPGTVPAGAGSILLDALGNVMVIAGFFLTFLVYRENTWTAATIQVEAGQQVISTGPYALIRHPMYFSAFFMLAGTPLALGAWQGLLALAAMLPAILQPVRRGGSAHPRSTRLR